jgi:glutaredoxin
MLRTPTPPSPGSTRGGDRKERGHVNDATFESFMPLKTVTIFSKPECHLCEEVEKVVQAVALRRRFRLEHKNILDDPVLAEKYKTAIPVIQVEGKEIARYRLTAFALEAALTE